MCLYGDECKLIGVEATLYACKKGNGCGYAHHHLCAGLDRIEAPYCPVCENGEIALRSIKKLCKPASRGRPPAGKKGVPAVRASPHLPRKRNAATALKRLVSTNVGSKDKPSSNKRRRSRGWQLTPKKLTFVPGLSPSGQRVMVPDTPENQEFIQRRRNFGVKAKRRLNMDWEGRVGGIGFDFASFLNVFIRQSSLGDFKLFSLTIRVARGRVVWAYTRVWSFFSLISIH